MTRQIVTGIDIGTFETKVVIAESVSGAPGVIGTGTAQSFGVERGFITNIAEASQSLRTAVAKAEKLAGLKVRRAYVAFGGLGLGSLSAAGSVIISRADMEISERDLTLAMEEAERALPASATINKRVINSIPLEWRIDGKLSWGQPLGLKAEKLEVKALFITCLEHHLEDLIKTVEEAGIEVVDVVAAPVAASFVTVSKKERRVGCLLADIGAETFSIISFENNNPASLEVLPVGGSDITNDIALGLKTTLEDAENIKLGGLSRVTFSKKKLEEILGARLINSFEKVLAHLKKIGRDGLLPAGVILTGGAAVTFGTKLIAEEVLGLPTRVGEIHLGGKDSNKIRDTVWAVACGAVSLGFNSDDKQSLIGRRNGKMAGIDGKHLFQKLSRWVSQFLP